MSWLLALERGGLSVGAGDEHFCGHFEAAHGDAEDTGKAAERAIGLACLTPAEP